MGFDYCTTWKAPNCSGNGNERICLTLEIWIKEKGHSFRLLSESSAPPLIGPHCKILKVYKRLKPKKHWEIVRADAL